MKTGIVEFLFFKEFYLLVSLLLSLFKPLIGFSGTSKHHIFFKALNCTNSQDWHLLLEILAILSMILGNLIVLLKQA